ncbi:MAG: KpsF/GutQ family sugar-phosphate isomerase [Methylomonas sp.]|nr:KpsF/GutQ family sugar-phosphate isomerase [Methylomonas sp.]PPD21538.1 MAG: D-arabinose 5-phosphate isomerase [Methylomonas sp.]PPD26305.1 MAG: D-arabinose 5-phosphate isomerase [Methylomonas sp.]PPD38021.1 MAG: D-arabinose 5-phosphate isomerase [Methylomonas sp.]PPD38427.1 MAG: D-arabinose 5-phosphate isomerase [Methylomonas sp.]
MSLNEDRDIRALAAAVIQAETEAISRLVERIDQNFVAACHLLLACRGRVVVTGMGKSGHIAGKIAATLASTGTPAFFVHPGEASHGDLGMITRQDVVLALSNSGETGEILTILPIIKRLGVPLIAMTGNAGSALARFATVHLDTSVEQEACPLGLAPTSSTTAALVMGDALAVSLLVTKGFTRDDFALSHPGGSLGKRLLLQVDDIMHTGDAVPKVAVDAKVSDALLEMTAKKLGMTAIVTADDSVAGVFTDGDLRRMLAKNLDIHATAVADVMTSPCQVIGDGILAAEAMQIMEARKINGLLVVDERRALIGALNMHDLLRAGIV